jgi:hypothetical protein
MVCRMIPSPIALLLYQEPTGKAILKKRFPGPELPISEPGKLESCQLIPSKRDSFRKQREAQLSRNIPPSRDACGSENRGNQPLSSGDSFRKRQGMQCILGKKRFPGSEQRSNLRTREVTSMNTEFCSERRFFHNVDENATIL